MESNDLKTESRLWAYCEERVEEGEKWRDNDFNAIRYGAIRNDQ